MLSWRMGATRTMRSKLCAEQCSVIPTTKMGMQITWRIVRSDNTPTSLVRAVPPLGGACYGRCRVAKTVNALRWKGVLRLSIGDDLTVLGSDSHDLIGLTATAQTAAEEQLSIEL